MGSTFPAAILVASHTDPVVDEVRLPDDLLLGQVLVAVEHAGVCASQLGEIDARSGPDRYLPHLLGHEGVGTVLEVGPGVSTVAVGDVVVMHWRPGAGLSADPPRYTWRGTALNAGPVTAFNARAVVSENRLTAIPAELDRHVAPLLGCALTTAFGAVTRQARVARGETVVVSGAGGVGLCAILAARHADAGAIIATDVVPARLEAARAAGATTLVDARDDERVRAAIDEVTGGLGADACIETSGAVAAMERVYASAGPRGRVVLVGVPPGGATMAIDPMPLYFGRSLTGSHGGLSEPDTDIPALVSLILGGALDVDSVPTHVHDLADVAGALTALRSGVPGRQLLRMP